MKNIIPYGKHYIDDEDIEAVVDVLKYRNLTQGTVVNDFEEGVAKFVGAKYAVAMSSWTAGLHMACLAAGVKENHLVATSPITFVASANAAKFCQANPIFSDIDRLSLNISPVHLQEVAKNAPAKIQAIIPVHFAGTPCDMKSISSIAKETKSYVIEDAAHALGAKYSDGSMVGSCKYSDMTGFSFHPVKSIAAGEGGMITTNDEDIYKKLLKLRSHGINKSDKYINHSSAYTNELENPWYYEMQELGYNYRITDIQCALGLSQLKKLPKFLARRRDLVAQYDNAFSHLKNLTPTQLEYRNQSSHHLYVVRINFDAVGMSRAELMGELRKEGVLAQVHYIPVTSHPYYQELGFNSTDFPEALNYYEEALSIPLYYSLTNEDQNKVISLITNLIG
jgi:perosamine synthetase